MINPVCPHELAKLMKAERSVRMWVVPAQTARIQGRDSSRIGYYS